MHLDHLSLRPIITSCQLIDLQRIPDKRGNLTVIETDRHCPFPIQRVFYMQDIASGETRGGHAHLALHQFLICLAGEFTILLDDGTNQTTLVMGDPGIGLYIPPGIWALESDFSANAICLVLASAPYKEDDYIRKYSDYLKFVNSLRA